MKEFISDLGIIPSATGPMKIFCDNTGAIALAKESRFHKRTKCYVSNVPAFPNTFALVLDSNLHDLNGTNPD